ncbi:MAG TPA: hypothetical protein VFK94_04585 [Patescibacteria group bacterium]|nr:hypothetical protein [Patescibacteria group bacterium]
MDKRGNYEAQVDELPMPARSEHHVCPDCGTEYFEKKCPNCAERDRLAAKQSESSRHALKTEIWAHIPQGTLTYTGPWLSPDWQHPSAEGDFKVSYLDESDPRLAWACINLSADQVTWVKVGFRFGVYLYKKHTRRD